MIITPFLFFDLLKIHLSGAQYYPNLSSNTSGMRGEKVWKGTLMVADLEQVDKKIDASEFHNVKLNAKELISP